MQTKVHSNSHAGVPVEETEELAKGVQNMAVDPNIPDLNVQPENSVGTGKERVSGLDSFFESEDGSINAKMESTKQDPIGLCERLQFAKGNKTGSSNEKKFQQIGPSKDIDKQRKLKQTLKPSISEAIRDLERKGLIIDELRAAREKHTETGAEARDSLGKR